MIEAIVCDWNGTLFEDKYEDIFFKELFKKIVFGFPKIFNVLEWGNLWKTKRKCEKIYRLIKQEGSSEPQDKISAILDLLNRNVIKNISISLIEKYIEEYAFKAYSRLDKRLLRPLKKIQNEKVILGIISSGCLPAIRKTLEKGEYYFDFIVANEFEKGDGRVNKFSLKIFRNKREVLINILKEKGIDRNKTVYIGDDWQDEDCFEEVKFPIVSFLADERFKNKCAKKYNAFVPKNERELEEYLKDLRKQ